jgi:hypothetical protein
MEFPYYGKRKSGSYEIFFAINSKDYKKDIMILFNENELISIKNYSLFTSAEDVIDSKKITKQELLDALEKAIEQIRKKLNE